MSKVIAIAGYGTGISAAVAEKFGSEGFKVALLARTQSKMDAAATAKGITAQGFSVDLNDAASVKSALASVASAPTLGPITVLHWNAYTASGAGGILTLTEQQLQALGSLNLTGFVIALQTVVKGFEGQEGTAILQTSADMPDEMVVQMGIDGLAAVKIAQRKLMDVLRVTLKAQGKDTYIDEVVIQGVVRGTDFAAGAPPEAIIAPAAIADRFYSLYNAGGPTSSEIFC